MKQKEEAHMNSGIHPFKWIPIVGLFTGIVSLIMHGDVGGNYPIINGLYHGACMTIFWVLIKCIL